MPKSTDQMLSPSESTNDKRSSSFSLSGGFQSVRRAVSGRGRRSEKDAKNEKDTEALAENLASSSLTDPPPAYTLTKAEGSSQSTPDSPAQKAPPRVLSLYSRLRGPASTTTEADKFRFLAEFDTVFLIDDSSSMSWNDRGSSTLRSGELSRWEQTRNAIEQIVPICMQYDQDGVDIYFLNDPYHMNFFDDPHENEPGWSRAAIKEEGKASHAYVGISDPSDVRTVFNSRRPMLNTPTGKRLGEIMETYVNCYEAREARRETPPKPLNIIVITDGEASDKDALRDNLIKQAERLDALCAPYHQLGVQFFQVGKDEWAARHLRELDDGLGKYRKGKELRDMVDCVTHEQLAGENNRSQLTADIILKIVLGAVNRHLDNQRIRQGLLVAPT
ncbi:hypothetical protein ANO14919_042610 [Xylariales sp. No.14919]|nr:hypothetical protein ANO14919_042610 [Xylariales sp. No.14919]